MKTLSLVVFFLWQVDVPFKNSDEFVVNVDLKFKARENAHAPNTYSGNGDRLDKPTGGLMPYLVVNLTQLKVLPDEVRVRAVDSKGKALFKRKISAADIHIEMGFVDDLKSGAAANEVVIYFMDDKKRDIRKIACTVLSDGTFQVNGKWNGKF